MAEDSFPALTCQETGDRRGRDTLIQPVFVNVAETRLERSCPEFFKMKVMGVTLDSFVDITLWGTLK